MKTIIEHRSGASETYPDLMPSLDLSPDGPVVDLIDAECLVQLSIPMSLVQRVIWEPDDVPA